MIKRIIVCSSYTGAMMFVQRKESVHVCFVRDKEANGKRHIDGRPAQGEKLFGDPATVQSLPAMVQASGVRLSPAIDRGTNNQRRCATLLKMTGGIY